MKTTTIRKPVYRQCRLRKPGHIYVETDRATGGWPVEKFLIDPVRPILELRDVGMCAQGVTVQEDDNRPGVFNIWDWVGGEYEPWDFIEEGRAIGFSGLIPQTANFDRITRESRRLLASGHAAMDNAMDLFPEDGSLLFPCPTGHQACLDSGRQLCVGLSRECYPGHLLESSGDSRMGIVKLKCGYGYRAARAPDNFIPQWRAGLFMWLPISRIVVIRDTKDQTHNDALKILGKSKTDLPIELQDF